MRTRALSAGALIAGCLIVVSTCLILRTFTGGEHASELLQAADVPPQWQTRLAFETAQQVRDFESRI